MHLFVAKAIHCTDFVFLRSILETRMAVAGKSIMEHNEILGMDAALRFLNQSLVHIGLITVEVCFRCFVHLAVVLLSVLQVHV